MTTTITKPEPGSTGWGTVLNTALDALVAAIDSAATAVLGKLDRPSGGTDGQVVIRAGAGSAWLTPLLGGTTAGTAPVLQAGGVLLDSVIPSGIARDSEVAAAVAALVASSPTALDTLAELAAALGNDPNAVATLTAAIGGKVSKTGAEAVAGLKTFTTSPVVVVSGIPTVGGQLGFDPADPSIPLWHTGTQVVQLLDLQHIAAIIKAQYPSSRNFTPGASGGPTVTNLLDTDEVVRFLGGTAGTLNVPLATSTTPSGMTMVASNEGTGGLTITADAGVTLNGLKNLPSGAGGQHNDIALRRVGVTNTWSVRGGAS